MAIPLRGIKYKLPVGKQKHDESGYRLRPITTYASHFKKFRMENGDEDEGENESEREVENQEKAIGTPNLHWLVYEVFYAI